VGERERILCDHRVDTRRRIYSMGPRRICLVTGRRVITREDALRIGATEIVARGLGSGARDAVLLSEMSGRIPAVYVLSDFGDCWIVYAERPMKGLFSSEIVVLSSETGAVLYSGSANDEG
jgi:hypothetical protein